MKHKLLERIGAIVTKLLWNTALVVMVVFFFLNCEVSITKKQNSIVKDVATVADSGYSIVKQIKEFVK